MDRARATEGEGLVVINSARIERGAVKEEAPAATLDSPRYDVVLPHVEGEGA